MGTVTISDFAAITVPANADILHARQSSVDKNITLDLLSEFVLRDSDWIDVIETRTADNDYSAADLERNHIIFSDSSSGNVTLGLFNGSTRDGSKILIAAIGSGNNTILELVSSGVTNYTLQPGDILELTWDNTNSVWIIKNKLSNTLRLTSDRDFTKTEVNFNRNLIVDSSSGNVTLGLFNGSDIDGNVLSIEAIGSGNNTILELVSSGVTNYTLDPGERIEIIWDNTNSVWLIKDLYTKTRSVSSDTTIPNGLREMNYLVTTTDTLKTTITLPDATLNKGTILNIIKTSNNYAPAVIDTYGSQTINEWNYSVNSTSYQLVPLFFHNDSVKLVSDGVNWKIINGYTPTFDTGIIYSSTAASIQIAGKKVTYTGLTGTFELYEVVTDGAGNRGIICDFDGSNLYLLQTIPYLASSTGQSGTFSNSSLTGQDSGATATLSSEVNSTRLRYFFGNNGYLLTSGENLGINLDLKYELIRNWVSANSYSVMGGVHGHAQAGNNGYTAFSAIDRNDNGITSSSSVFIQIGSQGAYDYRVGTYQVAYITSYLWYRIVVKG